MRRNTSIKERSRILFARLLLATVLLLWGQLARAQPGPVTPTPTPVEQRETLQDSVVTASQRLVELTEQASKRRSELDKTSDELNEIKEQLASAKAELLVAESAKKNVSEIQTRLKTLLQKESETATLKDSLGKEVLEAQTNLTTLKADYKSTSEKLAEMNKKLAQAASKGINQIADLVEVSADGVIVAPGGKGEGVLIDKAGKCQLVIKVASTLSAPPSGQAAIGTLEDAGIKQIKIVLAADEGEVDVRADKLNPRQNEIVLSRDDFCSRNRKRLTNGTRLRLRLSFLGAKNDSLSGEFYLVYERQTFQFDVGVGTYFAGGNIPIPTDKTAFAVFPALRAGLRVNLPFGDSNQDFYLQPNALLIGGGFVVSGSDGMASTDPAPSEVPASQTKILSIFSGCTLEIGKYLEAGYAYDWLNKGHLVVIAPGRILSSSILTF